MEQAAGPVNWRGVNHPKPRGLNRLWSLQAVARGADAVCYFQWRQSRQGAEKFHSGMLGHAGEQGRTFQEIERLGADLARIAAARQREPRSPPDVAVLHDWHSWWAGAQDGRPSRAVDYPEVLRRLAPGPVGGPPHHRLRPPRARPVRLPAGRRPAAVPADRRGARQPRSPTSAAAAPSSAASSPASPTRTTGCGPAAWTPGCATCSGIRTLHEWWPLDAGRDRRVRGGFAAPCGPRNWTRRHRRTETVPYRGGELDGLPAVLRKGPAWYVSTLPEPERPARAAGPRRRRRGRAAGARRAARRGRGGAPR